MKKGISSSFFYWKNKNDENLKHNDLLINKKLFYEHLDNINDVLKNVNLNEDLNVFTINDIRTIMFKNIVY